MRVWCVQARDGLWCATFRGSKPSEFADVDRTACGRQVGWRCDSKQRQPTCAECKARVERRRKQP